MATYKCEDCGFTANVTNVTGKPIIIADHKCKTTEPKITFNLPGFLKERDELLREDKTGKPDFTIIPYEALEALAYRFMEGAAKYERDNYKTATKEQMQTYKESLQRHVNQYVDGQTDDNHLWGVLCNAAILTYLEKKHAA